MKINSNTIIVCLLFVLAGCSDNSKEIELVSHTETSCSNITEELISCDFKEAVCDGEDVRNHDMSGDTNKPFIDLTEVGMTLGNDCIEVSWTMNDLPEVLTINHAALENNADNYSWSSFFDIDENGKPSKGDLYIGVDKDKFEGEIEKTVPVSKFINGSLGEVESMSKNGHVNVKTIAFVSARVSSDTLTIYLPKSLNSNLDKIKKTTPVNFNAQFNDGHIRYRDKYPN